MFGNLNLAGGVVDYTLNNRSSGTGDDIYPAVGFDMNVGYQYSFGKKVSGHMRYRTQVFPVVNDDAELEPGVIHGPELGITFRF
jgi:hypothetical protein